MEKAILNINGNKYEIENNNGNFLYYKIVNDQKLSPSAEELKLILSELDKLNNKKFNFEEIKADIKEKINNKTFATSEQIEEYLNTLGVTEHKQELLDYSNELLKNINMKLTPAEELCNEIIEEYKKAMSLEKQMLIEFKIVDSSLENKYMEVSTATLKDNIRYDFPIKYLPFNDDTKKKLIEPIIKEIILSSKLQRNEYKNINDLINDRVNYFIKTVQNCFVNIKNIESYYAREIEQLILELKMRYGDNNPEERIEEINQELEEEEMENTLSNDLDGPKLVRKKADNQGFISLNFVFIIMEFLASMFIILQVIFLS